MGKREDDRTHRVLLGIGLYALGLLSALVLIPLGLLGHGLQATFPSGNLVGPVGAGVYEVLFGYLGVWAVTVPASLVVWGTWSLGRWGRSRALRWTLFLTATALIGPPFLAALGAPAGGGGSLAGPAGRYGAWGAALLGSGLGWLGSALLLFALFLAVLVLTLGLGPLKGLQRAFASAGRGSALALQGAGLVARKGGALGRRLADHVGRLSEAWAEWRRNGSRPSAGLATGRGSPGMAADGISTESAAPGESKASASAKRAERKRGRSDRQIELWDAHDPQASQIPPIDLLTPAPGRRHSVSESALDELGETLVRTLRTFRVEGHIAGRTTGPVVTQFEVVPASGVKVGKIAALADDLALGLKAPSIRIVAPIPGKGAVGVEVPNPNRKVVYLREILESEAYRTSRAQLPLALGEDVTGRCDIADLAQMPHLLLAGVTGSGKSVCINAIISSLVYRHPPERLRLLLVDPKMVELGGYNVLPHLRHPVVTDNNDAATVLKWLVYEMERRYGWLSANGSRNLREYNRRVARGLPIRAPASHGGSEIAEPETLPYIVLIIDELADLMMTVQTEVERPLAYLAQKARATGIHLVVATQRPSVNVITGLIKANFPCRAAFRVASKVDSRTIIDQNGAETLLGNGDMLFMPPGQAEPKRIQGTFVSTEDTERLMEWYRARAEELKRAQAAAEEDILEVVHQRELEQAEADPAQESLLDRDPLFRRAAEVVVQHRQGSTSLLQRRLKVGYGRAARIVDQLEHAGIVGPSEGSKPREVLVTLQDLERICSAVNG